MKKRLICSIMIVSLMLLTGCENKTEQLENKINELESQINDMSTSTTSSSTTTTESTTTSSTTKSTKKKTTTTSTSTTKFIPPTVVTRTTSPTYKIPIAKNDGKNGYKICERSNNNCTCYFNDEEPYSC